jgi:hypothetical protein
MVKLGLWYQFFIKDGANFIIVQLHLRALLGHAGMIRIPASQRYATRETGTPLPTRYKKSLTMILPALWSAKCEREVRHKSKDIVGRRALLRSWQQDCRSSSHAA